MTAQTLKKSLLNYAICGKLSAKWRNSRILENSNSKHADVIPRLDPEISTKDFEPPFEIPNSWVWVKLGDICEINPRNKIDDNLEVSFVPMNLIADKFQNKFSYEIKKWKEVKTGFTHFKNGEIAFAKITPCFQNQKSVIFENLKNGYGAGTTEIIVINPKNEFNKYIFYVINSHYFLTNGVKTFSGTAGQQRINTNFVKNFYIPLPPKDEQEFIVSELEKLMSLADNYEEQFQKLEHCNKELKSLEKSLLNYAICGKLSAKWRNSRILENSNSKFLENSKDFKPPFEIPNSWVWVKLGDICEINLGKTPPTNESSFWGNDYPWVSIADLQDKQTITKTAKSISQKSFNEIFSKKIVKKGTLLLSFKLTIGRTSILGFDGFHNEAIASIIPKDKNLIFQNFLLNFLEIFVTFGEKTTAIKGATLNKEKLKNLYIPLPPKDEQEFIVSELEKLMKLCKEL